MMVNELKICTKCKVERELSEFDRDKYKKDGLSSSCKECRKAYRSTHKEAIKACSKTYYTDHKAERKAYLDSHKEEIKASKKAYYEDHKEEIKAYKKAYNKSPEGKLVRKKTEAKYLNAYRSRRCFRSHKTTPPTICTKCPSTNNIQAHHNDYNLPMEVIYLCRQCHADWHSSNTPLNRVSGIFTEDIL